MPVLPGYESKGEKVMINNFFALFIFARMQQENYKGVLICIVL